MGKKVKKKIRNANKERRDISGSHKTTPVKSIPSSEVVGDGVVAVKGKITCIHIEKGVDLNNVSSKIASEVTEQCEDCREGSSDRKGRSKHGKKVTGVVGKKKESNCVWVCLQCGQFSCGGVGLPTTPQCHAIRHNRQSRHPFAIQLQNPNLCWCFPCNSLIPVGKAEQDDGAQNNVLLEVVKLIKGRHQEGPSIDVEDVWFGSGEVGGALVVGASESPLLDKKGGYVVVGLANLGNTCFFNSVMQNLLSMDLLRDYFMKLDQSVGPMTMALKKLFDEINSRSESKTGISPRNLFGSICSRAPQFRGYQQQDSHELLRCLLDCLCTEELNMTKTLGISKEKEITSNLGSTFVDAIFGGQLSSTVSCMECRYSSVVYEPFLDLSLPVPMKKSLSKKGTMVSRSRKAKLPLKYEARKGGKLRGKGKTDSAPALVSQQSESEVLSSLASTSVPLADDKVDTIDRFWLDYIDQDSVSQNCGNSPIQVSESQHISHNDDILQNSSESESQIFPPNIEPNKNIELSKRNSSEDNLSLPQASEVLLLPYKEERLINVNFSEDNLPLLECSEVLLLPYKEESSTISETVSNDCEASSSTLNLEQDSVEFDGFGNLFNEPETDSVPNSEEKSSQQFRNSSESDPDEVDDTDAPVSINSCLTYFTKPELLTEHAWHCENCSKTLQGQQVYSKENHPETTPKKNTRGVQLRSQDDPLVGDLLNSTAESISLENGYPESDLGCTTKRDMDLLQSSYTPEEVSTYITDCKSVDQASFVDQASGSCSADDLDGTERNAKAHESNTSDKVDDRCVKVMRDATKRILINKAPQILTIHLKRFSQDARGRLSKLSGHVSFQAKIDLSPYMSPRTNEETKYEYSLIGVVEHSGTMRGGHYVAYVRGENKKSKTEQDNDENKWFYASDAHVREVSFGEVLRSEAYILFYKKENSF